MSNGFMVALARYGLVGLAVAGIDLGVYTLLLGAMGVWYGYAHTVSRAIGGVSGFILNRSWTFGYKGRAELAPHLVRFAITYVISYAASSCVLVLLVEWLLLPAVGAKMLAEGAVFFFNFLLLKQWTFQRRLQVTPLGPGSVVDVSRLSRGEWRQGAQ